jgi:hypothetical protein
MPKITVGDGPTHDPQDAPNARPSEEAYTDAMSRHGTPAFTPADERLVEQYQAMRKQEAEEERSQADGILVGEKGPEIVPLTKDQTKSLRKQEEDYESWTNDDLREELSKLGLDTHGRKSDLVERLRTAKEVGDEE